MKQAQTLLLGAALLAAGPAAAQTAMLSNWLPPTHVMTREIHEGWAEKVRAASNGALDFEVFVGAALLPPLSTMQGVADGVAQAGHVAAPYSPSELPIANFVGDLGYRTPDPLMLSAAFLDFTMNEPAAYAEWRENGVIPTATVSTPIYHYLCRPEIARFADLKGKRVRAPGGGWARFTDDAGMVSVNVPASEIYTSMERGAVDCVATDLTQLTSGSTILELTRSIVMLPLSPAYNAIHIAYNPGFWQGLTDDQRRLLLDQTALAMASAQVTYDRETAEALDQARAAGVAIVEPDAELRATYEAWIDDGFGGLAEVGRTGFGIADPDGLTQLFEGYQTKWTGLLADVDRLDANAVAAALKANLFDRIDVSAYGME